MFLNSYNNCRGNDQLFFRTWHHFFLEGMKQEQLLETRSFAEVRSRVEHLFLIFQLVFAIGSTTNIFHQTNAFLSIRGL